MGWDVISGDEVSVGWSGRIYREGSHVGMCPGATSNLSVNMLERFSGQKESDTAFLSPFDGHPGLSTV